ncbi:MAG: hypothetical protein JSV12_00920 [Candidatus Bathyarchaeota archaeon]|nr:MAG: hypothetical protein JSV12_00920 [Candidatus Bathyarchaeota archaeon]
MQKESIKINKKMLSTHNCLKFFALNKEGTVEDVAAFIKKDYTTALRIVRKLRDLGVIKLERLERTRGRGKEKRIYRIMLDWLFHFMLADLENTTSKFEEIVEAHRDATLTFRKWEYFKEKGLGKVMKNRVLNGLRNWGLNKVVALNVLGVEQKNARTVSDETVAKAVDFDALGIVFMTKSPEHLKQIIKEQDWIELMTLFKAIDEDYELRRFKEEVLFQFERDRQEELKALSRWKILED